MQLNLMVEDDNQTVSHASLSILDKSHDCQPHIPIMLSVQKETKFYGPHLLKPISIQDAKKDGSTQSLLAKYW
jgi:hypothetical protein